MHYPFFPELNLNMPVNISVVHAECDTHVHGMDGKCSFFVKGKARKCQVTCFTQSRFYSEKNSLILL